jgi:DNA invertase Pin-like site-specific DNA recombinase
VGAGSTLIRNHFDLMFPATLSKVNDMQPVGFARVSTERQADRGVSLEVQEAKVRAMATVQGAELLEVIVDGGESAKSLHRPGLQR